MSEVRIALANVRYPRSPEDAVSVVVEAIADAAAAGAALVVFPECYVPGYRLGHDRGIAPPEMAFLEDAFGRIARACAQANIAAVVGTERTVEGSGLRLTALVVDGAGTVLGFQDKVQLDPSEECLYVRGTDRRVFQVGPLTLGVVICHEGWRYPETVRWAVRHGAQLVVHPHFDEAVPGGYQPTTFADPANTFHEKAVLCRAAENTCWFATVNCASPGAPTTSAVARPDGTLLAYQPYGQHGLLLADLDLTLATRVLASRCVTSVS